MATSQTVTYANLLDIDQRIKFNYFYTTPDNTSSGYYVCAIFTNCKTQGDDGSIRDTQLVDYVGTMQPTAFTPTQIYDTVNTASAGPLLAAQLKQAYADGTATTVS